MCQAQLKKGVKSFLGIFAGDPITAAHGRAQKRMDDPAKSEAANFLAKRLKLLEIEPVASENVTQDALARLATPECVAVADGKQEVSSEMSQLPSLRLGFFGRRQVMLFNTVWLREFP